MISFLRGALTDVHKPGGTKIGVTLDVQQVGYDLQLSARHLAALPPLGESLQLHCHLQVKDDQMVLYGFMSRPERDLFRHLISVSGVGPQMALALLDTLAAEDLVRAVIAENSRLLARTPGVGGKTAERLILELKTKLGQWQQQTGFAPSPTSGPVPRVLEDVEATLLALGYTPQEIMQAIAAVGQGHPLSKTGDSEAWVREAIAWLSRA